MNRERPTALLCLDFDGVICNSMNECMLVTYNAYSESHLTTVADLPPAYRDTFQRHRYLVRDPGEYYLLVDRVPQGGALNQAWFKQALEREAAACTRFREKFFAARQVLRQQNMSAWLELHPCYRELVDFVKQASVPIDIITTKDEESVGLLLDEYGISDRVSRIFGQQALRVYGGKAQAIRHTCNERGVAPASTAYLDDHLQHLLDVRVTGVNLWYATWGYTDPSVSQVPSDVRVLTIDRVRDLL